MTSEPKFPRFKGVPEGVVVLAVDDLPDSDIPISNYGLSQDIKQEPQEGPKIGTHAAPVFIDLEAENSRPVEVFDLTESDNEDFLPDINPEDGTAHDRSNVTHEKPGGLHTNKEMYPERPIKIEPTEDLVDSPAVNSDMQDVPLTHDQPAPATQKTSQPSTNPEEVIEIEDDALEQPTAPSDLPQKSLDLGRSILRPAKKNIGGVLTAEQQKAMRKQQQDFAAAFAAGKGLPSTPLDLDHEEQLPVDENQPEDLFILQTKYKAAKEPYDKKVAAGELSPEEDIEFAKLEREYNSRKLELEKLALCEMDDQEESTKKKSTARKRKPDGEADRPAKKPRKNARKPVAHAGKATNWQHTGGNPNSFSHFSRAQPNLVDDAEAAAALGEEPTLETGFSRREKVLKSIRKNATAESAKIAAMDTKRLDQAVKCFTTSSSMQWLDQGPTLRGMKTPLKYYQIINVGWMRQRELSSAYCRGGILADQMGLGKTVQILALIVNGRPLKRTVDPKKPRKVVKDPKVVQDPNVATTLIVVPSALISQWKSEIEIHCKEEKARKKWGLGRVRVFRDSDAKGYDLDDFSTADVILTTYHDVMKSWPDCKYPEDMPESQRAQHLLGTDYEKRGPLHRFRFLRIVLDEGHVIRNPSSRTSIACCHLIGDHRWILSGTILVNGAHDLYAPLNFIGHKKVSSMTFDSFVLQYCNKNDHMSWDNLSTELTSHMARFTHKDSLFNKRLVTLPKPRSRSLAVMFSPLERGVYEIVRKRFRQRAKSIADDGSTQTYQMNILALITLLRQMTAHPLMLQTKILDYLEPEDFENLEAIVRKEAESGETGASLISTLRSVIQVHRGNARRNVGQDPDSAPDSADELDRVERLVQPKNLDPITEVQEYAGTGKGHGKNIDYAEFLKAFKTSSNIHILKERTKCCKCDRPADQPRVTACGHIYCRLHLEDLMLDAAQKQGRGSRSKKNPKIKCLRCGEEISKNDTVDLEDAAKPKYIDTDGNVIPSTKTLAVKSQVLDWLDPVTGDPEAKIIIFTQWIPFLRIVCRICEIEGWGYTSLHGGMRPPAKTESITKFKNDPNLRILVATLKTGGTGLNLTCASRVLNVDPYWNDAGELQAFSRIYRIGQDKETEFVNLITTNSIDERLVAIKQRKTNEINKVHKGHKGALLQNLLEMLENPASDDGADDQGDSIGDDDV